MRVAVTVVRSSDNIDPVSPDHGPGHQWRRVTGLYF